MDLRFLNYSCSQMAKRLNTHNRFHADEPETGPSRLEELTLHGRLEQREHYRKGWLRNLTIGGLVAVIAFIAFLAHR